MNENTGLYSDYLAMQWEPVVSEVTGLFSEPVEWRRDMGCGASKLNLLGTAATCGHPYVGDAERDTARCCKDNRC